MKKKLLSLLLTLAMAVSLCVPALAQGDKYAGIAAGAWYETAAKAAVDSGAMTGTEQGFEPDGAVTRGQIYQIVYNLAGKPAADKSALTDTQGQWYAAAADWAVSVKLFTGETFAGNETVTRAEVAQVMADYAGLKGIAVDTTGMAMKEAPDYAAIPAEYLSGVSFCYYAKVMVGDDKGNLNPAANLTRAQLAQVLVNFAALTPTYSEQAVTISVPEQDGIPAHDIPAVVTLPEKAAGVPGVVMLHGTGSEKNEAGGGYAIAAPLLAAQGIATIRIDFMGNGDSAADYANYNYTSAKIDAKAAADYLAKVDGVDGKKLGVMGWSQGGTDALLAAAAYPDTFQAVVTWAGAVNLNGSTLFPEGFDAAYATAKKDGGYTMKFDWRTDLTLGTRWFEEVKSTDILKETAKIKAPVLAINGDKDTTVTPENAAAIEKAAPSGKAWLIQGADHTFNVFSGDLTALHDTVAATAAFFQAKLNGALSGSVTAVSKYGNITTDLTHDAFLLAGFQPGDILTVTVNGKAVDAPYGDAYSNVDTGREIVVPEKSGYMAAAINMGNFAETHGAAQGTLITVSLKEKAGYLEEYDIRNIDAKRTNERKDYASDEVFANFRPVVMGKIPAGVLYRSSSPVNPELGRNTYADKLAQGAGIRTVLNLADDEATMKAYEGFDKSYYATLTVLPLNMGVDFKAEDFNTKLNAGLTALLDEAGPFLIHCNEGKDRAGFVTTLLEALMGASEDEMKNDYMRSFENYYHVEKGSEQWNKIAESNVMANLKTIASALDGAGAQPDYAKAAAAYLQETVGLTAQQVTALQTLLSTPVAAEKAA